MNKVPVAAAAFLVLLIVLVFALVPPFIRLFLQLQAAVGNEEAAFVRWVRGHQRELAYGFWTIWGLGLLIALPVMGRDLFGWRPSIGRSRGVLRADVGWSFEEVRRLSTFELNGKDRLVADAVFDFELPGGGFRFERCRYYWLEPDRKEPAKVGHASIGVSPEALTRSGLVEAHAAARARLKADGWRAGRTVHKTEEERRLHGGAETSGEGALWLKGETVLSLLGKRADEEKRGEAPDAGRWFQYLELSPRSSSSFERVEFDPASAP